jgi:hypothetical protein
MKVFTQELILSKVVLAIFVNASLVAKALVRSNQNIWKRHQPR